MRYILASKSPRRIEMMKTAGYDIEVIPADIQENIPAKCGMEETVMFLAYKKGENVRDRLLDTDNPFEISRDDKIISADTIVYYDGEIMGKPKDFEDGMRMLKKLSGKMHYVVSGVAVLNAAGEGGKVFSCVTKVYFKEYSDEELSEYLKTDEAYDKAGGYAIQGYFERYIDHVEGSYNNVVGLPIEMLKEVL